MPKAKILEIFKSIQGEGKYAGVNQVFVRFFECNMHCIWCDTPLSIGKEHLRPEVFKKFPESATDRYEEMEVKSIFEQVKDLYKDCHSVSLTGGEPLVQVDRLKELLKLFKTENMKTYLETNGTLPEDLRQIIDDVDIIAMDMKLPSSTQCQAFWENHEEFLRVANQREVFVKAVVTSNTEEHDVSAAIDLIARVDPNIIFILQPNYFEMNNGVIRRCTELQAICAKRLNDVRIIGQTHKFMRIR